MSGVRVLVGTHKGAFVITSDAKRKQWDISGPHFTGWDVYHVKGSPVDPNRIYAAQNTGWFGQIIQRSEDGGKTWNPVGNKFAYEGATGDHLWYDGTPRPWEFKRVWHLEPSLTDPDVVYAGVEDAALFRSTDGGQNWEELPALKDALDRDRYVLDRLLERRARTDDAAIEPTYDLVLFERRHADKDGHAIAEQGDNAVRAGAECQRQRRQDVAAFQSRGLDPVAKQKRSHGDALLGACRQIVHNNLVFGMT